jgi:hypothetical protein
MRSQQPCMTVFEGKADIVSTLEMSACEPEADIQPVQIGLQLETDTLPRYSKREFWQASPRKVQVVRAIALFNGGHSECRCPPFSPVCLIAMQGEAI